ncbi:hypothetical protein ACF1BQ_011135 [Bradyrhizobium sp. RDT10]
MAMTLAVEVMMITASTSMKLPNVSWPIESENDRGGGEIGGVSAVMWVGPGSYRASIYDVFRGFGNMPGTLVKPANPAPASPRLRLSPDSGTAGDALAASLRADWPRQPTEPTSNTSPS